MGDLDFKTFSDAKVWFRKSERFIYGYSKLDYKIAFVGSKSHNQ